jgi:MarR family transcriptional regulator for hemolysin
VPYRKQKSSFEIYREGRTTASIRLLIKMVLVVREFRNKVDVELRKIGYSAAQMEALGAIMNMPDPKSQTDVAKRLRLENATITRMVDILSKEGLVKRMPDPNDRRVNLLSISPAGEEALRKIFGVYDKVRAHILKDVPEDEYDRLHDMFDDMLKRLDEPIDPDLRIEDMPALNRLRD